MQFTSVVSLYTNYCTTPYPYCEYQFTTTLEDLSMKL